MQRKTFLQTLAVAGAMGNIGMSGQALAQAQV